MENQTTDSNSDMDEDQCPKCGKEWEVVDNYQNSRYHWEEHMLCRECGYEEIQEFVVMRKVYNETTNEWDYLVEEFPKKTPKPYCFRHKLITQNRDPFSVCLECPHLKACGQREEDVKGNDTGRDVPG